MAAIQKILVETNMVIKPQKKKVVVIGGGVCGLCSIKSLLEEDIEPICFEKTNYFGGTWRFHLDDVEGLASVTRATVANNSKEMTSISDFPAPKEAPNYMPHDVLYELIKNYSKKNELSDYIRFNHEVIYVDQAPDYDKTGRWVVTVRNLKTEDVFTETFDGVMICIGQFGYPNEPKFENQDRFKGRILHTKALKTFERFTDEKVVVVGIGCSGVDAATEISNVASKVYLSSRNGGWVLPRMGPYGIPFDICYLRRWSDVIFRRFPWLFSNWYFERILERQTFSHSLYSLKPAHRVWCQDPVLSDILPAKLIMGSITTKKNIKTFTEKGVIFEGETTVTEADAVVLATGYQWKFPFLADGIVTKDGNCLNLWKCMYPAQLPHPTLCILGFFLPLGPGFPLGEAQCRFASLQFNRKLKFPSTEQMFKDVRTVFEKNSKRFKMDDRCSTRVDYIEYLDGIYSLMGAKPNLLKLMFTDPKLFWALWAGPSLPYQYRLQGPHKWPGARKTILTYKERMVAPLRQNGFKKTKSTFDAVPVKLILALIVFIFWITIVADTNVV